MWDKGRTSFGKQESCLDLQKRKDPAEELGLWAQEGERMRRHGGERDLTEIDMWNLG